MQPVTTQTPSAALAAIANRQLGEDSRAYLTRWAQAIIRMTATYEEVPDDYSLLAGRVAAGEPTAANLSPVQLYDVLNDLADGENPLQMVGVSRITLGFSEASELRGLNFDTWGTVDAAIATVAEFKRGGGYWKTDFAITWEDGMDYAGRIDVGPEKSLSRHLIHFAAFRSGFRSPDSWTESEYRGYLAKMAPYHQSQAAWRQFLYTHQFTD